MKWQPKSDGFIIALWGLFTPFYPPLCRPKLHSENTTVLSNPHPYGSQMISSYLMRIRRSLMRRSTTERLQRFVCHRKFFDHNGNSGTLVVFMAGQIRIACVGIPGVVPLGGFSSTEVIEDELYRAHWTDPQLTERDLSDAHLLHVYKQAHSIGDTVVWTGEGFLPTGRTRISAYLCTLKTVLIPHYGSCHIFFLSCRLPFL